MARTGLLLLLVLLQALAPQDVTDPATGSIGGVVLDAVNNQPVEEMRLRLLVRPGSGAARSGATDVATAVSDRSGTFVFHNLRAGAYLLLIEGDGYVRQQYGQKTFPGEGTPIEVGPGQPLRGLAVRLTPTGTVSGRIRESGSRVPVAGVPVQLMRLGYNFEGRRTLTASASTQTDDRGEYRLYFLTPGRYYIRAGGPPLRNRSSVIPSNPNEIPAEYAVRFFPGAASALNGALIDVRPGSDLGGMDLDVAKHALYGIRGQIVDAVSGQPPVAATVTLYRREDADWESMNLSSNYRPFDGSFGFQRLVAGSYRIIVNARRTPPKFLRGPAPESGPRVINAVFQLLPPRPQDDPRGYATAQAIVDIAGSDVEGIVIPVSSGVSLSGQVRLDGRGMPAAEWEGLQVSLRSPDRLISSASRVAAPDSTGWGLLAFTNVTSGEYRVSVDNLPEGFYVREARFGGRDAFGENIQVADRNLSTLEIVIASSTARLLGTVRNARGDGVEASRVVLVPEQRDRIELFQSVLSNRDGQFTMLGVPPGNYKVFAWEAIPAYAYFDPDLLQGADSRGTAIRLTESSTQQLNLNVIPLE